MALHIDIGLPGTAGNWVCCRSGVLVGREDFGSQGTTVNIPKGFPNEFRQVVIADADGAKLRSVGSRRTSGNRNPVCNAGSRSMTLRTG